MIKHVVFFKLKDNSQENKKIVQNRLLQMKDEIWVLQNIEVGVNFTESPRAYDIALLTDFKTKEDLDIYQEHPYHVEIKEFLQEVSIDSKVVDFKY